MLKSLTKTTRCFWMLRLDWEGTISNPRQKCIDSSWYTEDTWRYIIYHSLSNGLVLLWKSVDEAPLVSVDYRFSPEGAETRWRQFDQNVGRKASRCLVKMQTQQVLFCHVGFVGIQVWLDLACTYSSRQSEQVWPPPEVLVLSGFSFVILSDH